MLLFFSQKNQSRLAKLITDLNTKLLSGTTLTN